MLTSQRVLEILRSGEFSEFVGLAEGTEFECKRSPYVLDEPKHRYELSKDVSAMANSAGGAIVLGLETERDEVRATDVVKRVRPFAISHFSVTRIRDVLRSRIYPHIGNATVEFFPSSQDPQLGLASIVIPPQSDEQKPFLVNEPIEDSGMTRGSSIGYFSRFLDFSNHWDAKDFHYRLQAGKRTVDIEDVLAAVSTEIASIERHSDFLDLDGRIGKAVMDAGLELRIAYILVASPLGHVGIPEIFASRSSPVRNLIQSPPSLRYAGFDVDAGTSVRIVEGNRLQAKSMEGARVLELWKDGVLLFAGPGDGTFLCWGRNPPPPYQINPIALLESTTTFCQLIAEIQQYMEPKECGVNLRLSLRGMKGDSVPRLPPGEIGKFGWQMGSGEHAAPDESAEFEETWASGRVEPEVLAYRLITQVYEWFGHSHDAIPYVKTVESIPRIDSERISKF